VDEQQGARGDDGQRGEGQRAHRRRFQRLGRVHLGETLALEPSSRILQSWRTTEFSPEDADSSLEVLLEKAKGGTKVTLVHTNIPAGHGGEYRKGWLDFYFKANEGLLPRGA